eukprot:CAMPEP_0175753582 /NCGR_PEP_ID=MMETSP0097-20121207/62385_1 /TAXON_ID=311494 /ORGANISM="Alexandrium monilatum, Strain CCMP3105" /LENGTH=70 /DNA_ID=CAMNT_0017062463 /DNA_START=514 /DNA_END=723 /DNA_ORIENTATION=-
MAPLSPLAGGLADAALAVNQHELATDGASRIRTTHGPSKNGPQQNDARRAEPQTAAGGAGPAEPIRYGEE